MNPAPSAIPHNEHRRFGGDRGSVSTEMVIVAPIALALLCLVALVGRTASAREAVDSAARDAARAASFERNANAASITADQAATRALTTSGYHCASQHVNTDLGSYGPGGKVTVTVTCEVALNDLGLIGLSGTRQVTSTSVEIIDTYKATTP